MCMANMLTRCYNTQSEKYKSYGARGIQVCNEWRENHKTFYDWAMNNGYNDDLTIDRIDVNGNYEPSNCRWVTKQEQVRNKQNTKLYSLGNVTLPLGTWEKCLGFGKNTLYLREKLNWNISDMLLKRGDDYTLYQHQAEILGLLRDSNKCGLYLDMGLRR